MAMMCEQQSITLNELPHGKSQPPCEAANSLFRVGSSVIHCAPLSQVYVIAVTGNRTLETYTFCADSLRNTHRNRNSSFRICCHQKDSFEHQVTPDQRTQQLVVDKACLVHQQPRIGGARMTNDGVLQAWWFAQ